MQEGESKKGEDEIKKKIQGQIGKSEKEWKLCVNKMILASRHMLCFLTRKKKERKKNKSEKKKKKENEEESCTWLLSAAESAFAFIVLVL